MTSSHRHRLAPELSRRTAPGTGISNSTRLTSTAPSVAVVSRGVSSAGVSIAVLLYLGSIGLVGGVTAGFFFGSGFLLLDQPSDQTHAGSRVHDRNAEVTPCAPAGRLQVVKTGHRSAEISLC